MLILACGHHSNDPKEVLAVLIIIYTYIKGTVQQDGSGRKEAHSIGFS